MTTVLTAPPQCLTYETYLEEGEIMARYDIIDGERIPMPNPTENHQGIVFKVAVLFNAYGERTGYGKMIIAPQDVLISRSPLRVRQPDVLFISNERRALNRLPDDPAPLNPAPELVVEIVSPSDTAGVLNAKLADYASVGVLEGWILRRAVRTVEVYVLSADGAVLSAAYGAGETVQSLTFPDLTAAVNAIFAE